MTKYTIKCKNCIHGKPNKKYIGCKEGKGTFPKSSAFMSCNKYYSIVDYKEDLKKQKAAIQLAKMVESGVS